MCLTFFRNMRFAPRGFITLEKKGFHKIFHNGKIQLGQLPALRSRDKTTVLFLKKNFWQKEYFLLFKRCSLLFLDLRCGCVKQFSTQNRHFPMVS